MAALDLMLSSGGRTFVAEGDYGDGDRLNLTLAGAHEVTIDGVDIALGRIVGTAADLTIVAGEGGAVYIDQALLQATDLASLSLRIDGRAEITLDGTDTALRAGLLKSFRVTFCGTQTAAFTYHACADSLPAVTTFHVDDMQAGHHLNILCATRGARPILQIGKHAFDPKTGYFRMSCVGGLAETHMHIRMTAAQAALLMADWARPVAQRQYWKTNGTGYSFIFPGSSVAYAEGSLVQTMSGYRPVESLQVGDMLICADGVARPLLWTCHSQLSAEVLDGRADMRPIRIRAGALAPGYPFEDMRVSPQLRLWVDSPAVRSVTGGSGGLIAARHLVGLPGIHAEACGDGIRYYHLVLANHEILVVNGIFAESTHLGLRSMPTIDPQALADLDRAQAVDVATTRHPLLAGRNARQISRLCGRRRDVVFENPGHYAMPVMRVIEHHPVYAAE